MTALPDPTNATGLARHPTHPDPAARSSAAGTSSSGVTSTNASAATSRAATAVPARSITPTSSPVRRRPWPATQVPAGHSGVTTATRNRCVFTSDGR